MLLPSSPAIKVELKTLYLPLTRTQFSWDETNKVLKLSKLSNACGQSKIYLKYLSRLINVGMVLVSFNQKKPHTFEPQQTFGTKIPRHDVSGVPWGTKAG